MTQLEWQTDVSEKLGALVEAVRRQNGNVAKLWEHMAAVEQHPVTCPLNERVGSIESTLSRIDAEAKAEERIREAEEAAAEKLRNAEARAAEKQDAALEKQAGKYWKVLDPILKYAAVGLVILLADHWHDISTFLFHFHG